MKCFRSFIGFGLLSMMLCTLAACGSNDAPANDMDNQNVLRVGMECAYAPNNWQEDQVSDTNLPIENVSGFYAEGYDVQMAKQIGEALDAEIVIVKLSWDGLIDSLKSGQIDMVIAGMAYDEVIDQIEGVDHLPPVTDVANMIARLNQGAADGIVLDTESAVAYTNVYPNLVTISFPDGQGFELGFNGACIGLRKEDTALLDQVNAALAEIPTETRQEMLTQAQAKMPQ